MNRFADVRTERIYHAGAAAGLPLHVTRATHRLQHLLTAARSLQDVGVFSRIATFPDDARRYGLHVTGKWFLTFYWSRQLCAVVMKLERRSRDKAR